jgi:hypothetical protein
MPLGSSALVRPKPEQRRVLAYEAARAERDEFATELADTYPAVARQLADLLTRVCANDRQIEHINDHELPRRLDRLLVSELVACGLMGFVENSVQIPGLTQHLRLPAFVRDPHVPYAWPRGRLGG